MSGLQVSTFGIAAWVEKREFFKNKIPGDQQGPEGDGEWREGGRVRKVPNSLMTQGFLHLPCGQCTRGASWGKSLYYKEDNGR